MHAPLWITGIIVLTVVLLGAYFLTRPAPVVAPASYDAGSQNAPVSSATNDASTTGYFNPDAIPE